VVSRRVELRPNAPAIKFSSTVSERKQWRPSSTCTSPWRTRSGGFARFRWKEVRDGLQCRRLASAVVAEERDNLALADFQADVVQGDNRVIVDRFDGGDFE
jgi:hypothetical protein